MKLNFMFYEKATEEKIRELEKKVQNQEKKCDFIEEELKHLKKENQRLEEEAGSSRKCIQEEIILN